MWQVPMQQQSQPLAIQQKLATLQNNTNWNMANKVIIDWFHQLCSSSSLWNDSSPHCNTMEKTMHWSLTFHRMEFHLQSNWLADSFFCRWCSRQHWTLPGDQSTHCVNHPTTLFWWLMASILTPLLSPWHYGMLWVTRFGPFHCLEVIKHLQQIAQQSPVTSAQALSPLLALVHIFPYQVIIRRASGWLDPSNPPQECQQGTRLLP